MKFKHVLARSEQAIAISKCSSCPRRQVGCVIIEPKRNVVISDAYNGYTRGGSNLCGGNVCLRDENQIETGVGDRNDVGCLHAEMGAICNAAAQGISTLDCWMVITIPPCFLCAKLVHHCGIKKVIISDNNYATDGCQYLVENGVEVIYLKDLDEDISLKN